MDCAESVCRDYFGWTFCSAVAVSTADFWLLVPGAVLFGIGFGLFHSSLDSWFAEAATGRFKTPALESGSPRVTPSTIAVTFWGLRSRFRYL